MNATLWARVGRAFWERWKSAARAIGNFQARLLLSLFYIVVITPFAIGVKLLSDPLRLKPHKLVGWVRPNHKAPGSLEAMRRQF
jgi:hypothetical protein